MIHGNFSSQTIKEVQSQRNDQRRGCNLEIEGGVYPSFGYRNAIGRLCTKT